MTKVQTASGFTLVELAIALMIIGLLIAGVLKGVELAENAKVTATLRQAQSYDTAMMSFMSIYGQYPGDINNPSQKIPGCSAAPCNISGNGDGHIGPIVTDLTDFYAAPVVNENIVFWEHLSKARLIGNYDSTSNYPKAGIIPAVYKNRSLKIPASGDYGVYDGFYYGIMTANGTAPVFMASQVLQMDLKVDDGKPYTGSVTALDAGTAPASCMNGQEYNVVSDEKVCNVVLKMLRN